ATIERGNTRPKRIPDSAEIRLRMLSTWLSVAAVVLGVALVMGVVVGRG
ncbi:MAG: hypothetical protein HOP28_08355, partial [Gemmatimonadales bacterium]|nr:hypothetical protein [Gemmatimonadales bacterium]